MEVPCQSYFLPRQLLMWRHFSMTYTLEWADFKKPGMQRNISKWHITPIAILEVTTAQNILSPLTMILPYVRTAKLCPDTHHEENGCSWKSVMSHPIKHGWIICPMNNFERVQVEIHMRSQSPSSPKLWSDYWVHDWFSSDVSSKCKRRQASLQIQHIITFVISAISVDQESFSMWLQISMDLISTHSNSSIRSLQPKWLALWLKKISLSWQRSKRSLPRRFYKCLLYMLRTKLPLWQKSLRIKMSLVDSVGMIHPTTSVKAALKWRLCCGDWQWAWRTPKYHQGIWNLPHGNIWLGHTHKPHSPLSTKVAFIHHGRLQFIWSCVYSPPVGETRRTL